ncbi:PhoH family protein [Synechococcus sp. Tobar12-5m-g]|uniref:PhoH family protein n=1 Tax=unclassified Synechococcus TaxID=2626047 RepID=UPI0020CF11C5|nr:MULTISPECIES: PhoH family protein [unclassified Synechococcus]MCP9773456.1 PhoH family protein [Synechococcus sp. Tobar12-5m-g]MCP9874428.1 PhoH family protein [Synechococcus sp. Cruz CV-v-12]
MKKTFVLDTNVLLHDPGALSRFEDNNVVIPIEVVEEIDRFKRDATEKGRNARLVSRLLDGLRQKGNLAEGVEIEAIHQGRLKVVFCRSQTLSQLPPELQAGNGDNNILAVALEQRLHGVMGSEPPVILVTKDTNLRIKADAVGLIAQDYNTGKVAIADLYPGLTEWWVTAAQIEQLHREGGLPLSVLAPLPEGHAPLHANEGVTLVDGAQPSHTLLARYCAPAASLRPLQKGGRIKLGRVSARNREQTFALDLLLDSAIQLLTLVGKAGTGKTLLALAAGLHQVADEPLYDRLLVTRPVIPLGKDIGFLPGDLQEKMGPWMQPVIDNLDFLLGAEEPSHGAARPNRTPRNNWADLKGMGLLEVEAISYIRGRSIPRQFMVVDEAQNLTPHEVKTIVTRVGEGTKIVFTGDPYQIDNPYVDADSNGLTWLVERFKGQELAGHVTLHKGERSALAELAANLL